MLGMTKSAEAKFLAFARVTRSAEARFVALFGMICRGSGISRKTFRFMAKTLNPNSFELDSRVSENRLMSTAKLQK